MKNDQKICCFAGLNPSALIHGFDEHNYGYFGLKSELTSEIEGMVRCGVTTFLTGMTLGPDTLCAEIVLDLKKSRKGGDILLIACLPYEDQATHWNIEDRERYFSTLVQVDDEIILQTRYTNDCMSKHRRRLVDASSHMIAVHDGKRGRAQYMINYAEQKGLDIVTIHSATFERKYISSSI